MKAALVFRSKLDTAERLSIASEALLIGRNEDNDLVLNSPRVSRYHARVFWSGSDYKIEDLGSKNGTWRNGSRLESTLTLKDGDTIQIGDITLTFEVQGQETQSIPAGGRGLPDGLTKREAEVLKLVASGHSNKEVAGMLVLSVRTVERHVENIYAKSGARNRAEVTSYALTRGLT